MTPALPLAWLAPLLAGSADPRDGLALFHRELLAVLGGRHSFVLERRATSDGYHEVSAAARPGQSELRLDAAGASELDRLAARGPAVADITGSPSLAAHVGATRALIVPVEGRRRNTVLVVTDPQVPDADAAAAGAAAAREVPIALEWTRLARESHAHEALQHLAIAFLRDSATPSGATAALGTFAREANALLGARRTSIWLHDRRARELALAARSEGSLAAVPARVADDADAAAARGRRMDGADFVDGVDGPVLVAPLRGWRRGLGALVIDEVPAGVLDDDQVRRLASGLARHLSVALENVQLVEEILRQRRLLEDTFNSLADLLVVTDRRLRIVQVNEALAERLDRPRQHLFERTLEDVLGGALADWVAESDPAAAGPPMRPSSRAFETLPIAGSFVATATPLGGGCGDSMGHVIVLRDVTEQRRLESEREALRGRLAQSEKLAALGQFVAGVAHEMNNPLQGLLGHLELLISHTEAARPVRAELRRVHREGERAARIVRNLLVFTGSRRMTRRRLRIERVLARALASRRNALARARIDVVRHLGAAVPAVIGDPLLLQQAFLNVLINAEHAIREHEGARTIEVRTRGDGAGRVITTVRDSGNGIASDVLPRIFDPFFTTRDAGKGTGLGLAVTYGIIQEHGGSIHAENAPDGGAVFTIDLPGAPTAGDERRGE